MFGRFRALAQNATHVADHPADDLRVQRAPSPVGEAFEHADGSIAVYLDALPVSGRLLLVPVDDLRAKPIRRGAIGGTDTAKLRMLEAAARELVECLATGAGTSDNELQTRVRAVGRLL